MTLTIELGLDIVEMNERAKITASEVIYSSKVMYKSLFTNEVVLVASETTKHRDRNTQK